MKKFVIDDLPLSGLKRLTRSKFEDHRGYFSRLFCQEELQVAGWTTPLLQLNHSVTLHEGTVRGLHYQTPPYDEMKLVTCVRGKIWDVMVDVRLDSPTFLCWHAELLTAEEPCSLLIPQGFAHGFQSLTPNAELIYCSSASYQPKFEAGLRADDPTLAIDWPLAISNLSTRDAQFPLLNTEFKGIIL